MKSILLILILIPSIAFGTFTEFYCDPVNGSNNNGGSDTGSSATYTSTNGNWNSGTGAFIPTDGTNPVTAGVTVGQFASVYIDAASVGVFIGRVTAVVNAANGQITVSVTIRAGSPPTTSATARTIKVGGAFKGPNGSVTFPFNLTTWTSAVDASGDLPRFNMKNSASYTTTSGITASGIPQCVVQGYTSSVGDGGKFTLDGSTNAVTLWSGPTSSGYTMIDGIFVSSATTGSGIGISDGSSPGSVYIRIVTHGNRGNGMVVSNSTLYECESYNNNVSNSSSAGSRGGITASGTGTTRMIRCYSHDNTGSNAYGFECNSGNGVSYTSCIASNNGSDGFDYLINGASGSPSYSYCDAYNNGGDGIGIHRNSSTLGGYVIIESCNLVKNTGKGINNAATTAQMVGGFAYNNGYGQGTQANSGGDATLGGLIESGKVSYQSNVTPWSAPTTGNFTIVNTNTILGLGTGRGVFVETDGTHTGTVGYPDIGAAQHNDTCSGTGPCISSSGKAN